MTEGAPVIHWPHRFPRRKANARKRAGSASSSAKIERGFQDLSRLRNSTAKEDLPEGLKRVVKKLRRREEE